MKKYIEFLHWLKTRLHFKYNDQDQNIIQNIDEIIVMLQPKPFVLDKNKIMKICKKLYPTFEYKKDESSLFDIGYSNKEKLDILNHVTKIIQEYESV